MNILEKRNIYRMRTFSNGLFAAALAAAFILNCVSFALAFDQYKLCPKCSTKVPKLSGQAALELNYCPGCGADIKSASVRSKTNQEKIVELVRERRAELGEISQSKAMEWFEKGETHEDRLTRMACYLNSIELDPRNERAHNNLGVLYDEKMLDTDAVACFRKAVEIKPDYAIAVNNLARCLALRGSHDEALGHFNRAIELDPKNAAMKRNLGDLYLRMKRFNDATAEYKKAAELDPDGTNGRIALWKIDLIEKRLKNPGQLPASASTSEVSIGAPKGQQNEKK